MNKNGVIAVVVVVAAIVLVGLWAMRGSAPGGADCDGPPAAPTGVGAAVDGKMVTVNWAAPQVGDSVTTFIIEAWQPQDAARTTFIAPGNVTTFRREAPPAVYNVQVFARNACGTSQPSEQISVTVR